MIELEDMKKANDDLKKSVPVRSKKVEGEPPTKEPVTNQKGLFPPICVKWVLPGLI